MNEPIASTPGTQTRARSLLAFTIAVAVASSLALTACGSSSTEAEPPSSTGSSGGATTSTSAPKPTTTLGTDGAAIYSAKCAGCHGKAGEGNMGPALVGVADRMTAEDQIAVVTNGRGAMLAFSPGLSNEQIAAVVEYTRTGLS